MTKLKIRITQFNPDAKQERFFQDTEQIVFLHEMSEDNFFEVLEAIGKIVDRDKDAPRMD